MITSALLYLLYATIYLFTLPIRVFDDVSLDSNVGTAISNASQYISAFNAFLPMTTLVTILGIFIAFEVAYFTYKTVMWIIKKIPTIS